MRPKPLNYRLLLSLAERTLGNLNIQIRYESFSGMNEENGTVGAICTLHGRKLLIADAQATTEALGHAFAAELSRLNLSDVFVPPLLRDYIENLE